MPINSKTGDPTIGDWTIIFQNWERSVDEENNENHVLNDVPIFCSGATCDNVHPECCKGSLCPDVLEKLGCSPAMMKDNKGFCNSLCTRPNNGNPSY